MDLQNDDLWWQLKDQVHNSAGLVQSCMEYNKNIREVYNLRLFK